MYDEEYFCPNCGAILNDQYGFDPDCDLWTCISCGKTLYGEGVYEGERYEGVMWYCDSCGALLNKQLGFHDYCDTWTCTECWHSNRISDDEIYESENEYQESQRDRLDENNDDYDYDGETMYCDHCGEMLNKQDDFDEFFDSWICTECSHLNTLSEDSKSDFSNEKYSDNADYSNSCNHHNKSTSPETRGLPIGLIGILFAIMICIPLGILAYFEIDERIAISQGKISAGYYKDLIGEDYEFVKSHFETAGFADIELIDLDDSGLRFWKNGKVESVSVNGDSDFDSTDWFYPDDKVIITYH